MNEQKRKHIREHLRTGVENCLIALANGFLTHPDNHDLRCRLTATPTSQPTSQPSTSHQAGHSSSEAPLIAFHTSLLRLVYRFLFLLVSEERGLIGSSPVYHEHYSLDRLKRLLGQTHVSSDIRADHPTVVPVKDDLWESLRVLWRSMSDARLAASTGVFPLHGNLFEPLELDACRLSNADLFTAFRHLVGYRERPGGELRHINYAELAVEELGGVYESLLDLHPTLDADDTPPRFRFVSGSGRKTTGLYYTPPELVTELLKSALEPVLAARQEAARQSAGLRWKDLPGGFRQHLFTRLSTWTAVPGEVIGETTGKASEETARTTVTTVTCVTLPSSPVPNLAKVWDELPLPARERLAAEWGLLSLRVLDPACGAGYFLLAAARKLGRELARLRTGEDEPSPESLREAIRDVVSHCLYGVDKNPLAVELCQVVLWLESHCPGKPLLFLDHRIRRGNSLIGLTDIKVLEAGLPNRGFVRLEGEDFATVKTLRRQNARERRKRNWRRRIGGQTARTSAPTDILAGLSRQWAELDSGGDDTPDDVHRKKNLYTELRRRLETDSLTLACDLWTAAFFQWLTPEAVLDGQVITTGTIREALAGRLAADSPVAVYARALAGEYGFFHWPLEFPELAGAGGEPARREPTHTDSALTRTGFDVILGNPPWERINFWEQQFILPFFDLDKKTIERLLENNLSFWTAYDQTMHMIGSINRFLRGSGEYPLTMPDLTMPDEINVYPTFTERIRRLLHSRGRAGIIVPTAIATDVTNQPFLADLMQKGQLVSLFDFDNLKKLFPDLIARLKFCLLTLSGDGCPPIRPQFAFFCHSLEDLCHPLKLVSLSKDDLAQIAPNTGTLPTFRTRQDADLTRAVYAHVPVLVKRQTHDNPWGLQFRPMLVRLKDSRAFRTGQLLKKEGYRLVANRLIKDETVYLPVYSSLLVSQFNHRHLTSINNLQVLSSEQLRDPNFLVQPIEFVPQNYFRKRTGNLLSDCTTGLLGYMDLGRSTDERTSRASIIPWGPTSTGFILSSGPDAINLCLLCATYNSLVFDYLLRQLLSEISFLHTIPPSIFEQVAAPPPAAYTPADLAFIVPRVLELSCTAWDMQPFADDVWSRADEHLRGIIRFWWEDNQAACEKWRMEDGKCGMKDGKLKVKNKKWEIRTEWLEVENGMWGIKPGQWEMKSRKKHNRKKPGGNCSLFIPDSPSMPFVWDESRRARICAELDAYYARLYGLTRKQLRYILDPADLTERELEDICDPWEEVSDPLEPAGYAARISASTFPGETFRVLKEEEMKQFGEYRTRRFVLEAWLSGIGDASARTACH